MFFISTIIIVFIIIVFLPIALLIFMNKQAFSNRIIHHHFSFMSFLPALVRCRFFLFPIFIGGK